MRQVVSAAGDPALPRRSMPALGTAAVGTLLIGLVLQVSGVAPWELWVPLWWACALMVWLVVAKQPLRALVQAPAGTVGADLIAGLLGAIGAGAVVLAYSAATGRLTMPEGGIGPADALHAVGTAVVVGGLLNALPEELTLRGVAQRIVGGRIGGMAAAVVIGLWFGLAHLPTLLAGTMGAEVVIAAEVLQRILYGIVLGWSVVRLGSLWFALSWHVGGNVLGVTVDTLGIEGASAGVFSGWGAAFDPQLLVAVALVLVLSARRGSV